MGFKEDVEVLSKGYDYKTLCVELARDLRDAKTEIARLNALLDKVCIERDQLLAQIVGRSFP